MPPSTKNLRERIADAIYRQSVYRDKTDNDHTVELMLAILSSELSLAVKGLREAVEEAMTVIDDMGDWGWCKKCVGWKLDFFFPRGEYWCSDCGTKLERKKRVEKYPADRQDEALSSFDSKAKEILGVLTHED